MPECDVTNAAVFAARGAVNGYPDHSAKRVRALLAERHGVEPEQLVLGNGAGDLLQTAALTLLSPDDELVTPWPSYPLYPLMARRAGARPVPIALDDGQVDIDALLAAVNGRTRVIAICNPNDPTGTYMCSDLLAELLARLPEHVYLLLDEAIVHFQDREDEDACLRLVDTFPRLVVFRSFSNAYGLSGMRAGYAVGFAGSGASARRACACPRSERRDPGGGRMRAATRGRELARRREMVIAQRRRVDEALTQLPLEAPRSQAHFMWMRASGMSETATRRGLRARRRDRLPRLGTGGRGARARLAQERCGDGSSTGCVGRRVGATAYVDLVDLRHENAPGVSLARARFRR